MNQYKNRKYNICEKKLINSFKQEFDEYIKDYQYSDDIYEDNFGLDIQEYYRDYDGFDAINPLCFCSKGQANVFLINERCASYLSSKNYNDLVDQHEYFTQKYQEVFQNYYVDSLYAYIDLQEFLIDDIEELSTKFHLQNIYDIQLYLFIDQSLEAKSIKFIQSILNLKNLEHLELTIVVNCESNCVRTELNEVFEVDYLNKIQKLIKKQTNLNYLNFFVDSTNMRVGVTMNFSDEGNIDQLSQYNNFSIGLDAQQAKSIQDLQIEFNESEEQSFNQLNTLMKLTNLQYIEINSSENKRKQFVKYNSVQRLGWIEYLFTIIPKLKQIQILILDCPIKIENADKEKQLILQSYNIQGLTIHFVDSIIPIQYPNLHCLDLTYTCNYKQFDEQLFLRTLSSIKHLKILNIYINLQHNYWNYGQDEMQNMLSDNLERVIKRKLLKNLKRLVYLYIEIEYVY